MAVWDLWGLWGPMVLRCVTYETTYGMLVGCGILLYMYAYGMLMRDYLWVTYVLPMGYLWDAYGIPMGCLWDTYGMPIGCLWNAHGILLYMYAYGML